jgi:hypothetical protein
MSTTTNSASHPSPAPGIIPTPPQINERPAGPGGRPVAGPRPAAPSGPHGPLARLLAVLRGDKYMAGAYPPVTPPTER